MIKKCFLAFLMALILHGSAVVTFAQKIYLFCEGDVYADGLGPFIAAGTQNVRGFFSEVVPRDRIVIYNIGSWRGPDINKSKQVRKDILKAIQNCPAGPSDTIFFYWCGHGAFEERGHFLWMPANRGDKVMYRSEILQALKAKKPRLAVLMTESCHVYQKPSELTQQQPPSPPASAVPPIIKSLFFDYKGVVDFNTSSPGQTSKVCPAGGCYTLCFLSFLDHNLSRVGSWKAVLNNVDAMVRDEHQNAYIWSLPQGSTHASEHRPNKWSEPNFHPDIDDRIIYVGEVKINNETTFHEVINKSDGPRIVLTLIDKKSGKRYYMLTNLLPKGTRSRLGLEVQTDPRGGVRVVRVIPGSPATRCSYLMNGDVQSNEIDDKFIDSP